MRGLSFPSGVVRDYPCSPSVDYAQFYSRSHDPVIRVYDDAGNVIETHDHKGEFK